MLENDIGPRKESIRVTGSKFLNNLYNDPIKYKKYKEVVDEMILSEIKKRNEEYNNTFICRLPLGFPNLILLSEREEETISQAVLKMSINIYEGKYTMCSGFTMVGIECDDKNRDDMPIPYIHLSIRCPVDDVPKHGFYLSGVFKKEKVMREIIGAKIDKITFLTKDLRKFNLMSF